MKWGIITDSSCDHIPDSGLSDQILYANVPFIIQVGPHDYLDDGSIDLGTMLDDMESCPDASRTACPPPDAWTAWFNQVDQVIAITISANLSGSYNSAMVAKDMVLEEHPDKKIFVLDSCSAGTGPALFAEAAIAMIEGGASFEQIVDALTRLKEKTNTIFALCSFNNLVKNGRVSRLAGFIAGKLSLWGIGVATRDGRIDVVAKARGLKKLLDAFGSDMEGNGFRGGNVVISHCMNEEYALKLKEYIKNRWPESRIRINPARGLCSFYAERKGLIVSY